MGRIHVLPDRVANQIAAGEVVERPASVVKELLENSLDAGARRLVVRVEAGGRKLIQASDDGCGMLPDDALLAFERHATSKIKDAEDLLQVATLGFRGEALPAMAAVSRLTLETCAAPETGEASARLPADCKVRTSGADQGVRAAPTGTRVELAGGKILRVEEAGMPQGTTVTVRDLFFNVPARKKFLKTEATELAHVASLVTHYALAHPEMHMELHSATGALLLAPPVAGHRERVFQVFGKETLEQLLPLAAVAPLAHPGLPQPPPWKRGPDYQPPQPGELRLHGFAGRPELQKLNRNSIFVFVNRRLVRDRLVQHALTEAYRNILPAGTHPVVLLFLEMPGGEVDVNVHPAKTEVRFRQPQQVHDFIRDSVRAALVRLRPVAGFVGEISAQPTASPALTPPRFSPGAGGGSATETRTILENFGFALAPPEVPPRSERLDFAAAGGISVAATAARGLAPPASISMALGNGGGSCGGSALAPAAPELPATAANLGELKPLGQIRNSFIVAVDGSGLWIVDQHVAHERVLFERLLQRRARAAGEGGAISGQRLLMPMIVELTPAQQAGFAEIRDELARNGFELEAFGSRTVAVKAAPAGVDATEVEHLLFEVIEQAAREERALNLEALRAGVAASIACHAAIKVNLPLEPQKMEWLLAELARTECPMTCPHGRPVLLRYSLGEIERAFKRS